ncbi:hypothetical protein PHAMO_320006 [Magnetospirillum molischianum DSM 120]|uniref:Uncharacterized protein n=1 Tax=Magnetospirillum molischianum DSM 120 TaxID=1150626 RepID=H8FUJ9_MAGML|nr:hypothetical protein PHAMO_320006 [Magnetospirillum molischianum DSM 120]
MVGSFRPKLDGISRLPRQKKRERAVGDPLGCRSVNGLKLLGQATGPEWTARPTGKGLGQ